MVKNKDWPVAGEQVITERGSLDTLAHGAKGILIWKKIRMESDYWKHRYKKLFNSELPEKAKVNTFNFPDE
ncbi:MAG TPA: hypothetical protein VFW78_08805 [Bacteroidia bacterium]|nr:hypothetical protein [Bacteroidia bacterium]